MRVDAHDRKRLEQWCRYITRPALSDERVQVNAAGQVELKLKTPGCDGTTHLVMTPLVFMQRLAAPLLRRSGRGSGTTPASDQRDRLYPDSRWFRMARTKTVSTSET